MKQTAQQYGFTKKETFSFTTSEGVKLDGKTALAEETPVGRLGGPGEVAKMLLFLAGEDAGYITGQVLGVNGGLVI